MLKLCDHSESFSDKMWCLRSQPTEINRGLALGMWLTRNVWQAQQHKSITPRWEESGRFGPLTVLADTSQMMELFYQNHQNVSSRVAIWRDIETGCPWTPWLWVSTVCCETSEKNCVAVSKQCLEGSLSSGARSPKMSHMRSLHVLSSGLVMPGGFEQSATPYPKEVPFRPVQPSRSSRAFGTNVIRVEGTT